MATHQLTFEVHFHSQDTVSFFQESNITTEEMEKCAEILSFALHTIRQMSNIKGSGAELSLAGQLVKAGADFPAFLEDAFSQNAPVTILKSYGGRPGRKRFLTTLSIRQGDVRYDLAAKGFGFFATGVLYYVPIGVMTAAAFIGYRRSTDQTFLKHLANTCILLGSPHTLQRIGVSGQSDLATLLVRHVMSLDSAK